MPNPQPARALAAKLNPIISPVGSQDTASAEGYIFRNHHSRTWQGYADKSKAGLVELKLTTIERDDGSSRTAEQVLITRQGITKLAERLERRASSGLAMAA